MHILLHIVLHSTIPVKSNGVATFRLKTNLKVKMGNFPGVQVVDPFKYLFDKLRGLLLTQ